MHTLNASPLLRRALFADGLVGLATGSLLVLAGAWLAELLALPRELLLGSGLALLPLGLFLLWLSSGETINRLLVWAVLAVNALWVVDSLLLLSALFPLLLALPLLALLVWFGVNNGLAPLRSLTVQLHQRSARSLQPLALNRAPVEVHSLVNELNLLLERLGTAMEAERRLTSDAAHEIRTPLASLRTHAQVALRSSDPAVLAHGLQQVSRSVERIGTLMEQILLLARLDNEELHETFTRVDLGQLSEETIADLAPQAIDKNIELILESQGAVVMGVQVWLGIMLGNLVSNALRYTPEGGRVEVRLGTEGSKVQLWVLDSGPGVAAAEQAAIFTRFYRSPGVASGTGGSGLGLPIVKRVVEIHQGHISLHPGLDGRGLGVRVELPSAQLS